MLLLEREFERHPPPPEEEDLSELPRRLSHKEEADAPGVRKGLQIGGEREAGRV